MELEFGANDQNNDLNSIKSFSDAERGLDNVNKANENSEKLRNYYKDLATEIKKVQKFIEENSTSERIQAMQKHAAKMKSLESVLTLLGD